MDSIQDISISANHVIQKYGREEIPVDQIKYYIGDGLRTFAKGLAGDKAEDDAYLKLVVDEFSRHYETQLLKTTKFYPGAEKFLKDYLSGDANMLATKKVGVVSNKEERLSRVILEHLLTEAGLNHREFVDIFGGDTFEVKKPHPKPLLEMISRAEVKPLETLMIGDSRQDLEAAQNAGTHFLAVSFGYNTVEKLKSFGAENFLHDFSELEHILANWKI